MGNKQTLNPQVPQIQNQEWQYLAQNQHMAHGDYRTLSHLDSHEVIDEYEMYFVDEEDFKMYLDSFIWRLNEPHIVRTFYLNENHQKQLCSRTYAAKVYLEHIKTRLSDITDIPFPENLYVLDCALEGFHKLYNHLNYFKVEQSQICVDTRGLVKVWLNSDLSKNYPSVDSEDAGDETDMVEQIITMVDENTDSQSEPKSVLQYFRHTDPQHNGIVFQDAKQILRHYIKDYKVQMPSFFESILQINTNSQNQQSGRDNFERRVDYSDVRGDENSRIMTQDPLKSIHRIDIETNNQSSQQIIPFPIYNYAQPLEQARPFQTSSSNMLIQREQCTNSRLLQKPQYANEKLHFATNYSFVRNPPLFAPSSREAVVIHPLPCIPSRLPINYTSRSLSYSPHYSPSKITTVTFNNQKPQVINQPAMATHQQQRAPQITRQFQTMRQPVTIPHSRHSQKIDSPAQRFFFKNAESISKGSVGYSSYQEQSWGSNSKTKPLENYNNRVNRFIIEQIRQSKLQQSQYSKSRLNSRHNNYMGEHLTHLNESNEEQKNKKYMISTGPSARNMVEGRRSQKKQAFYRAEAAIRREQKSEQEGEYYDEKESQVDSSKAFYFTLDTAEELDPQIAADLKKYSIE